MFLSTKNAVGTILPFKDYDITIGSGFNEDGDVVLEDTITKKTYTDKEINEFQRIRFIQVPEYIYGFMQSEFNFVTISTP